MSISMIDVKKLRDVTSAGMMDCKNALIQSNGNFDEALKLLKEKGLADAKKRSDRETKEGGVFIKENDKRIAIILLGCETDFVSKNEFFINTKDTIINKMIESGNDDINAYNNEIQDVMAKIKENIEFKKAKVFNLKDNQCSAVYIHGNNKIGVVAIFECQDINVKNNPVFKEFANNICLHITANFPYFISEKDVPENEIKEQMEIFTKQMEGTNKPANIIENIVKGKLSKHFSEICLLNQKYVKDDKITVDNYIKTISKELNVEIKIVDFVRYMIGS